VARIVVIGGGICGLGAALLLGRDGHDVVVLERDGSEVPDAPLDAWEAWQRKGVAQFRQPHNFMPGMRRLLEAELPDVQQILIDAGASKMDFFNPAPFEANADDDRFWSYTARRPVGEWVFARVTDREPSIEIRRGARVVGLLEGTGRLSGVPHVTGVRTDDGSELSANLVIDATGRGSRSPTWLAALGAAAPAEEQADCGFSYFTRYFHGDIPQRRTPVQTVLGTISVLTLPGDNDTWSVTIFTSSNDVALKRLRDAPTWTKTVRACPAHAHWLEGEPITEVLTMSGVVDRHRDFRVDGAPIATGFVAVADAWACTNPSAGRGMTIGLMHAKLLRDLLRASAEDAVALAIQFHARTESEIAPWYHAQIAADRARFAEMEALRDGGQLSAPTNEATLRATTLFAQMASDPVLYRAALEYIGTLTPLHEVVQRPAVAERIDAMIGRTPPGAPDVVVGGPTRVELLALVR